MKIQVIQREFKSHGNYERSYKICNCEYCCEGIKHLPNVDFFFEYTENTENSIEDDCGYGKDLGVMLQNSVTYHDAWDYDDYGYTEDYYYKLNFCPICGKKIEVEVIDSIDVTEEYENLSKEREAIHKKWNRTDSIKKQNEYQSIRHKLDQKIETFYHTDMLPDKGDNDEEY
jgi:hypothetical protein